MIFLRPTRAALFLAVILVLGGCVQNLTFRVVDAETKVPLANLSVVRSWMHFGLPLYIDTEEQKTDAQGLVSFKSVDSGENIVFNPPQEPMLAMGGAAYAPRWTNGRRDVLIVSLWPEVMYRYPRSDPTNPQRYKAVRAGGVIQIPIPNEGKARVARIQEILASQKPAPDTDRELVRQCANLAWVGAEDGLPAVQSVFHHFSQTFAAGLNRMHNDFSSLSDLLFVDYDRIMLGDGGASLQELHHLYDTCSPRMNEEMAREFKARLDSADRSRDKPRSIQVGKVAGAVPLKDPGPGTPYSTGN